jgi:RNA recognition motif-containing protein
MGTKLYVGNLNYNTTEDSLRQAFGANGREVASVSIIMDRETGRPRGFAFVEMTTDEGAQTAMRELDGTDLDGRTLRINEAREREARGAPRPPGAPGGFSSGPRPSGGGYAGGGGGYGGAARPPSTGYAGGGGYGGAAPPSGGAPSAPAPDRTRTFGANAEKGGGSFARKKEKEKGREGAAVERGAKERGGGRRRTADDGDE